MIYRFHNTLIINIHCTEQWLILVGCYIALEAYPSDVLSELGRGTFGAVNKVHDKRNDRVCVLKRIPFTNLKDIQVISTEVSLG
jgi:hypothetical protein